MSHWTAFLGLNSCTWFHLSFWHGQSILFRYLHQLCLDRMTARSRRRQEMMKADRGNLTASRGRQRPLFLWVSRGPIPHSKQRLPVCPPSHLCHDWLHHSQSPLPFFYVLIESGLFWVSFWGFGCPAVPPQVKESRTTYLPLKCQQSLNGFMAPPPTSSQKRVQDYLPPAEAPAETKLLHG